ncbi:MAG: hypothetical protein ACYDCJ_12430 [Gammaproteobacteria bacterium]
MTVKTFGLNVKYYRGMVMIDAGRYANNRLEWRLINTSTGGLVLKATVNLPDCADPRLDDGSHVLIKDWSQNEGTLRSLVDAKIVEDTGETFPAGQVEAHLCRVLP